MNNKDSDSAWTKSWCCTYGYHDECLGCRCKHHLGGGGQDGERQMATASPGTDAKTRQVSPALSIEQVWNPYDNKWERIER